MTWEKKDLDLVLVPAGLLIMFVYHIHLFYRYVKLPHKTIVGFENNDKRAWVERVMQVDKAQIGTALTVIGANTTASTFLASVSLTLSALIGAWISNSTSTSIFRSGIIYGNRNSTVLSIKYITLLFCFLLAFACFIESARLFIHANYLITMPNSNIPVKNVQNSVIGGGEFWHIGLRALYFAIVLLLWFFGPIPMFISAIGMVVLLRYLDRNTTPLHNHQSPSSENVVKTEGQSSS